MAYRGRSIAHLERSGLGDSSAIRNPNLRRGPGKRPLFFYALASTLEFKDNPNREPNVVLAASAHTCLEEVHLGQTDAQMATHVEIQSAASRPGEARVRTAKSKGTRGEMSPAKQSVAERGDVRSIWEAH